MRWVATPVTLAFGSLLALAAAPAFAQSDQQTRNDCADPNPQTRIRACSEIIKAGQPSDVNMPVAYNNRGLAYSESGQSQEAINDFDQAISLFPNYAIAYSNRGLAYEALGQMDRAVADFSQAIKLNANYAGAYNNRCYALAEIGQQQQAVADCQKALALTPNDPKTLDSLGFAYFRLGNYGEAISTYDAALKLSPQMPESLYGRGVARLKTGDSAGDADLTAASAIDPNVSNRMQKIGVVR